MMKHLITALLLLSALTSAPARAQGRLPVTSMKPLLLAAIERGSAYGELVGPAADLMARQFGSQAPIQIDVRVVKSAKAPLDPDCKRLEVSTSQAAVREKGQAPETKTLKYELNFCRDGRFPEDRLDASR
ncbi:MAG: hypothetical protein JNM52_01370 [Betaproteobacteria bacterium]|nr:hypothetical protein [Betaproteobacteria bacterium]